MTSLKEEYEVKKKLDEMSNLVETKYMLDEYFILVEAIDDQKLQAMADAVGKLEQVLSAGPLAQKVPALKAAVDQASKELHDFVNNKGLLGHLPDFITKNKSFNPITKSMSLFAGLTKFFKDQMPHIMSAFKLDKMGGNLQEDDMEQNPSETGSEQQFFQQGDQQNQAQQRQSKPRQTNPNLVKNGAAPLSKSLPPDAVKRLETMFQKGLQTGGFLGFLGKGLPYIKDASEIARQLTTLTPNELRSVIAGVDRIQAPIQQDDYQDLLQMAKGIVPQDVQQTAAQASGQQTSAGSQGDANAAFSNLKQMDDQTILQIVKNAQNVPDLLKAINSRQAQQQSSAQANSQSVPPTAATKPTGRTRRTP